jgi:hypothetical protein
MPAPNGGTIRLRLDRELAQALDHARATDHVSRTVFARTALVKAVRAAGHLPTPGQNAEAAR